MRPELALFALGLATGGSLRLALALLLPLLPARRAGALAGLFGVCFGLGGTAPALAFVAALGSSAAVATEYLCACVPVILVASVLRAWRPEADGASRDPAWNGRPRRTSPRSILMSASLCLQAMSCVVVSCWLTVHLSRAMGVSGPLGASAMVTYWASLCLGWVCARRMPRPRERPAILLLQVALAVAGGLALLAGGHQWSVAGGAVLGLGSGILFPMTLGMVSWPYALGQCRWIARSLHLSLPIALFASWLAGVIASGAGPGALVATVVVCAALAPAALAVLVADHRVAGDPAMI